ncbi:MAG: response regulator [Deltaproteobacteria bacterium]|nr:response regulator [Deltaproteobacteria bacterium]
MRDHRDPQYIILLASAGQLTVDQHGNVQRFDERFRLRYVELTAFGDDTSRHALFLLCPRNQLHCQAVSECLRMGSAKRRMIFQISEAEHNAVEVELIYTPSGAGELLADITVFEKGIVPGSEQNEQRQACEAESCGKYIKKVSSEFRTPMNGIIGMAGLLLDTPLTSEQQEYAKTMRHSAESLMRTVNDLMDLSRIQLGELALDEAPFDFRLIIRNIDVAMIELSESKGLSYHCVVDDNLTSNLVGDAGRLRQAISTIILNSIESTTRGNILIRYEEAARLKDKVVVEISISDTGISLDENQRATLFDAFFDTAQPSARKFGGSGLGLYVARKLIETMDGRIEIIPIHDGGITFRIRLSLLVPEEKISYSAPSMWTEETKIIVFDEIGSAERISIQLVEQYNCECEYQDNAEEVFLAMRNAQQAGKPFVVAILDMDHISDYSGYPITGKELGMKIKQHEQLQDTIIIMLTARGMIGDVRELRQMGFEVYLPKPVNVDQLGQSILLAKSNRHMFEQHLPSVITRHTLEEELKRGAHILLVEDNVVNQKVAQKLLEKLGYQVTICKDGEECIRALSLDNYDLVFMDIQMPNMNGFEATRIVRDTSSKVLDHTVPIVAMTAYTSDEDKHQYLSAGMNDYMFKPVSMSGFDQMVTKWVSNVHHRDALCAKLPREEVLFEPDRLREQLVGDEDLYNRIIESYLHETVQQIGKLKDAVAHDELKRTRDIARMLINASDDVTARSMKSIARQIEQAAISANRMRLTGLIEKLDGQFEKTRQFIGN